MISLLLDLFPYVAGLGALLVVFLGLRLHRHLGQGSYSAGPLEVQAPEPPGQEATPWELRAIDDQLTMVTHPGSEVVRRYDLTATINRLTASAGLVGDEYQLPITATEAQLEAAVARIEERLDLPQLSEGPPR